MTESRSTSSTAATVAKIGVTAALVAGMAVTAPVATFAADESDQDVDAASETAKEGYYYISDSSYGLSSYLSEAVSQGYRKISERALRTRERSPSPRRLPSLRGIPKGSLDRVQRRSILGIPTR